MKVTSALFSSISGKLNGAVGSKARGGIMTLRTLVTPRNPRSTPQLTVRAAITAAAAYWASTLTEAQRTAWNALATATKSGFDQFIAANTLTQQAGLGLLAPAPASMNLAWLDIPEAADFSVSYDAGTIAITLAGNGTTRLAAGNKFLFYIQRAKQRPGWANRSSNFVFAGVYTSAATATTVTVPSAIASAIGALEEGDQLYVKVRGVSPNGELTEEIEARVDVTIV